MPEFWSRCHAGITQLRSGRSPVENSTVGFCRVSPGGFPVGEALRSALHVSPPSNSDRIGLAPQAGLAKFLRLGHGLDDVRLVPSPCVHWSVFRFWAEQPGTISTLLFTGRVADAVAKVPSSAARANCAARSALSAPLPHRLPRGSARTFRTPALPSARARLLAPHRTPRRARAWYGPRRLLRW